MKSDTQRAFGRAARNCRFTRSAGHGVDRLPPLRRPPPLLGGGGLPDLHPSGFLRVAGISGYPGASPGRRRQIGGRCARPPCLFIFPGRNQAGRAARGAAAILAGTQGTPPGRLGASARCFCRACRRQRGFLLGSARAFFFFPTLMSSPARFCATAVNATARQVDSSSLSRPMRVASGALLARTAAMLSGVDAHLPCHRVGP